MSGVLYTTVTIPNDFIREAPTELVYESVVRETITGLSEDIESLMTISEEKKTEIDARQYRAEVVILSVDEYKKLKDIEKQYKDLKKYIGMYH